MAFEQGRFCAVDPRDQGRILLARPAGEIRLNEIIKVLDEDVFNKHCGSYTGVLDSCVHNGDCGIRPVIVGLHEIVENALSQITLAQLVGNEKSVDAMFHQIQGIHRTIEPSEFKRICHEVHAVTNKRKNN